MSDEETYSVIFASLKHPLRRKILRILASGPKSFTDILQEIDIESAHLSYHLEGLGGLLKKTDESKYVLSDLGRAGLSLMTRIEEPVKLVSPAFLKTPQRLKIARLSLVALVVLGVILLGNGVFALSSTNVQKTTVQTNCDSGYQVFQPGRIYGCMGYIYSGDGIYGIEANFGVRDAYSRFPLIVRLLTPLLGGNYTNADYWNQSWYEWYRADQSLVPGIHEEFSLTLLAQGGSYKIISQSSFDHVHPSPGQVIGQFRPEGSLLLFQVAPDAGTANVTLSGFRAYKVEWFYFPQPDDAIKNSYFLLGSGLAIPSVGFLMGSRYLERPRKAGVRKPSLLVL